MDDPQACASVLSQGEPPWAARFLSAQDSAWDAVLRDLRFGRADARWMPFVFPVHLGLGTTEVEWFYGIRNLEHAYRYLKHEQLGARLRQATTTVMTQRLCAQDIFGVTQVLRFRSCMTLFMCASIDAALFEEALRWGFNGVPCMATIELLGAE